MQAAKRWWFAWAVVAVCVLGLLTGCSRDPKVRGQKYVESGERYYEEGAYRSAGIQFDNAIQVDSNSADAHYWKAKAATKTQELPTALQEYQTAIQLNPNHSNARLDLAEAVYLGGRVRGSEAATRLAPAEPAEHSRLLSGPGCLR